MMNGIQGQPLPPLRPMDIGEILDRSFKLYIRHWKPLTLAALVAAAPAMVLNAAISMLMVGLTSPDTAMDNFFVRMAAAAESGDFGGMIALGAGLLLFTVISLFLYPLVQGAVIVMSSRAALNQPVSAGEGFRLAGSRYGALLGTFFLKGLAFTVAVPVLVIAGLVVLAPLTLLAGLPTLAAFLVFSYHAILIEQGDGGFPAFKRSWQLVKPRFWPLLGLGFIFNMLTGIAGMMISWVIVLPLNLLNTLVLHSTALGLVEGLLKGLPTVITMPFMLIGLSLAYFDTRMRLEALDLELMASSQAATPEQL